MLRSRIKPIGESTSSHNPQHILCSPTNDTTKTVEHSSLPSNNFHRVLPRRKRSRQEESQTRNTRSIFGRPVRFALIFLGCLCFVRTLEVGYKLSIGGVSAGEFGRFFVGWSSSWIFHEGSEGESDQIRKRNETTVTIDNYYSRPHIREAVPLIVGGSDGSGTRAFVRILEQLDVPMVVQDRGTMDVHAKEMYHGQGWPTLVISVLNVTRSASYNVHDLPVTLFESTQREIGKFLNSMQKAGKALVSSTVTSAAVPGRTSTIEKKWATGVLWGFKAPVSILLLPLFREQLPAMKVLHVVRDGRDTALSDNHSPVHKFYSSYYSNAAILNDALLEDETLTRSTRYNVKAMQLWNDWNKQVYDYGVRYSDGKSLDVLVMRTEDLVHYPLESVHLLADFVGSLHTAEQLCCLSRMVATDLGQSNRGRVDPFEMEEADKDASSEDRQVDPRDFENIRRRFVQFRATGPQGNQGRRLLQQSSGDVGKEDTPADIFKSGEKVATANHPEHDIHPPLRVPNHDERHAVDSVQVAKMQQILNDRRAAKRKEHEQVQSPEEVKSRYGKWMKLLSTNPEFANRLRREGRESLALFGYDPPRDFMDFIPRPALIPRCDASLISCSK